MPNQSIVRKVTGDELKAIQSCIDEQFGANWRAWEWTTKDRRKIPLSKMDSQHVVNALHYFEQKQPNGVSYFRLTLEAVYRGLEEMSIFDLMKLKETAKRLAINDALNRAVERKERRETNLSHLIAPWDPNE